MMRAVVLAGCLMLALLGAGCGSGEPAPTAAPEPEPAPAPVSAEPAPPAEADPEEADPEEAATDEGKTDTEAGELTCYLTVVDLAGKPLARMAPILSRTPNALDEPLAIGPPTEADGTGSVRATVEGTVFLRAWDPELDLYPNNFYEILQTSGTVARDMTITMVPASNLAVRVFAPNGTPLADATLHLMLIHPERGPWWPSETTTNRGGMAIFEKIPPGSFSLVFRDESGRTRELGMTNLPPAGLAQVGEVRLQ